jgi:hypothetical protein
LDEKVVKELLELQEKGININQLIKDALKNRREEIAQEKERIVVEILEKQTGGGNLKPKNSSRYIPVRIKNILIKDQGTKCSIPGCNKPGQQIHHAQRFALSQYHNPHFMPQVCTEHHKISHSIDIKFHQVRKSAIRNISS